MLDVASPLEGAGTMTIACTKGAAGAVGISRAAAAGRRVSGAATRIVYDLYKDSKRAGIWGRSAGTLAESGAAGGRNARSFAVNGGVAAGQGVAAGSSAAAVTATINF